ncbi:MAG: hypothetical protein ABUL77_02420, partial [Bacteroidota bacterium]
MRTILIAVVAVASFAVLEGLFYTARFMRERKSDELRRRLQSMGTAAAGSMSLLRQGNLSRNPAVDAMLRLIPVSFRIEAMLEQAEIRISVA